MNKIKSIKISLKTFLLAVLFVSAVEAKSLPPGTGEGDVPSNVLILLSKGQTMAECMAGGDYFCAPDDIGPDGNGDMFVIQYPGMGLVKMHYDTLTIDQTFADDGVYEPALLTTEAAVGCRIQSTDLAFGLTEYWDGHIYASDFYLKQVVKINSTTGECVRKWDTNGNPNAFSLVDGHLFISNWGHTAGAGQGMNSINLTTEDIVWCGTNSNFHFQFGIAADHKLENLYAFKNNRTINRFPLTESSGNYCPSANPAVSISMDFNGQCPWEGNSALRMHPRDERIIFIQGSWCDKLGRATLDSNKNSMSWDWVVGRSGTGKSTASDIQLSAPWGLGIDIDPERERLLSAGWVGGYGQVFDFEGNFIKSTDGKITRIEGASDAIQRVVTDTSLSNDIDFGLGYWSDGSASVSNWTGSVETGQGVPCTSNNCLKVAVSQGGKNRIVDVIDNISPSGNSVASTFADLATDYYNYIGVDNNNVKVCPIDPEIDCQRSYIIVIGDGNLTGDNSLAKNQIENLATQGIITIMVGYGPGLTPQGRVTFNEFAAVGDPEGVLSGGETASAIFAKTPHSLRSQLSSILSGIISQKFSFTAPAISATIQEGGSLFQATFEYRQNKEWKGTLLRKKVDKQGIVDENDVGNWSFVEELSSPSDRKIWTVLNGNSPDYTLDYNNFKGSNHVEVGQLFTLTGGIVADYHRQSSIGGSAVRARCNDQVGVADGGADDVIGLIEFTRGVDYFDYDGDCDLTEQRAHPFGEIYHSELIVVGAPNAETSFRSVNQEAYWRHFNNYENFFKIPNQNRPKVIYVGSNSGALHAINATNGQELWAFVPPFIAAKLPQIVNVNLNSDTGGGSNAIYGVDGSPTVHDMYFRHPITNTEEWATILMIPYGRGGAGFSVLDITTPENPLHLYSVFNDQNSNKVHYVDHMGTFSAWDYISPIYNLAQFKEAKLAQRQADLGNTDKTCGSDIDPETGDLSSTCYQSSLWTLPIKNATADDITITKDGEVFEGFFVFSDGFDTKISFTQDITYQADNALSEQSNSIVVRVTQDSLILGVQDDVGKLYDYSTLAETWSSPRIFRMPNTDAPDDNTLDDIYVAVMGAGKSSANPFIGTSVFVINLEDPTNPGKIESKISIVDDLSNGVVASTPATPTVITPDTGTSGIRFRGALVYQPDYEGKITKINLTNMKCDNGALSGNCPQDSSEIKRFDSTILFDAETDNTNRRFMFHSLDAAIGTSTTGLWLFNGTGDYDRINDTSTGVDNILFGIRDKHYPKYVHEYDKTSLSDVDNLSDCENTTDQELSNCPTSNQRGWYIKLDNFAKVSAEPTVYAGRVYFPVYEPNEDDRCAVGTAYICAVDDECGFNKSVDEIGALDTGENVNKCKSVGTGILSRVIVFANKLFANISGSAPNEEDLISINTGVLDAESVRDSWRENY